ncbi:hypothetical protein SAMN05421863_107317 [Nitrosomonas communis]|uniref:Uncharacterized protein n=1 Tax=Nitrosomonas communis TaxID=44574 RepID=A0A1I4UZG7_9PROT|nr:hypothetical protein SAMN05421863_107317 [Nitrosomonas communis]
MRFQLAMGDIAVMFHYSFLDGSAHALESIAFRSHCHH